MNRLLIPISFIPILACSSADRPVSEESTGTDNCSALASNLEYTECWQRLANETRADVDSTFARAREVAQESDEQESYGVGVAEASKMGLDASLTDSHAEWITYSDRQCRFEGWVARGGTGTRSLVAKCQHRLNLQRKEELESAIKAIEENH